MVSGNDCKYCNLIESYKTIFQKFQDYFLVLRKACFLYYFGALLKGWHSIQAQCVTWWRRRILNFKSFSPFSWTYGEMTPLFIKWMTSQAYNNDDALLLPLQIWNQPHRIKSSDRFTVNTRDIECFEHLHGENTKPSVNVKCLACSTSSFWWFLQKGGEVWRNSNRTGQGCWCSCVCVPPPRFGREEYC